MASLARDLQRIETDEPPSAGARDLAVVWANHWRARHGMPPLGDPHDETPPEEAFYRRARSLGMVGIGRTGS